MEIGRTAIIGTWNGLLTITAAQTHPKYDYTHVVAFWKYSLTAWLLTVVKCSMYAMDGLMLIRTCIILHLHMFQLMVAKERIWII
jgi:hypothetical protein